MSLRSLFIPYIIPLLGACSPLKPLPTLDSETDSVELRVEILTADQDTVTIEDTQPSLTGSISHRFHPSPLPSLTDSISRNQVSARSQMSIKKLDSWTSQTLYNNPHSFLFFGFGGLGFIAFSTIVLQERAHNRQKANETLDALKKSYRIAQDIAEPLLAQDPNQPDYQVKVAAYFSEILSALVELNWSKNVLQDICGYTTAPIHSDLTPSTVPSNLLVKFKELYSEVTTLRNELIQIIEINFPSATYLPEFS